MMRSENPMSVRRGCKAVLADDSYSTMAAEKVLEASMLCGVASELHYGVWDDDLFLCF